jgi:hypothetical protein
MDREPKGRTQDMPLTIITVTVYEDGIDCRVTTPDLKQEKLQNIGTDNAFAFVEREVASAVQRRGLSSV